MRAPEAGPGSGTARAHARRSWTGSAWATGTDPLGADGGRALSRSAWAAAPVLFLLLLPGVAATPLTPVGATAVVQSIYQTPANITEQSNFSVHLQVSDATNVKQVYFTFCQLSSSLCYLPVVMDPVGSNWYVGTTNPMTAYPGMVVGVRAGYNITILYNDNSTYNEPAMPNAFGNLTVAQSVTGEYMYQMTVADHVYGLTGVVSDSRSGAGIAGANVSLSPGSHRATTDASGAYHFAGLFNGTYAVSVEIAGYATNNLSVTITGQNVVQNVQLTNSTLPPTPKTGSPGPFYTTALGQAAVGLVAVLIVLGAVALLLRSRRRSGPGGTGPSEPVDPASPPSKVR